MARGGVDRTKVGRGTHTRVGQPRPSEPTALLGHAEIEAAQDRLNLIGTSIFEFADLQRLSGYERRADVERWAAEIGLPTKPCRNGAWTTLEAMNQALGVAGRLDATLYDASVV